MSDDQLEALARLAKESDSLLRAARMAAQAQASEGIDSSESVSVALDTEGRVAAVTVAADWQQRLGDEEMAAAVAEAVQDASVRRLAAWGAAFEDRSGSVAATCTRDPGAANVDELRSEPAEMQRRLQAAVTRDLSPEDRTAALTELLRMLEAVERGIDDVSCKLPAILSRTHTGRSSDGRVAVTVTGGGEVQSVHFDRRLLRDAHATTIGRQVTGAFRAAYKKAAADGVQQLIADSSLGELQQATQDPFGLARRLRMTD
ncbi:YbaB/EbfC family nucleoid-associated protein [Actinoplanes sp. GCM10030250]|uniref:YbaB/EbfC family nucleoid-associated protein n=1 Tax=Actinoplanes sp. GCM10030250 TaxID=3273376 RepID=UPI0036090D02